MKAVDGQVRWWLEIGLNTETKMFTDIASPDMIMQGSIDMFAVRSVQDALLSEVHSLYPVGTNIFKQIYLMQNRRLLQ